MKIGPPKQTPPSPDALSKLDPSAGLPWIGAEELKSREGTEKLRVIDVAKYLMREREAILLSLCVSRTDREVVVWQKMLLHSICRIKVLVSHMDPKRHLQTIVYIKETLENETVLVVKSLPEGDATTDRDTRSLSDSVRQSLERLLSQSSTPQQ
ncbi:hypothetical protein D9611_005047 [Ephemerocybe angulata]|uniref:Uncharacterized protein n=1 Tax=Ephemerocybe angulata TaxID=980116 RepID=A0A8H5EXB5_9AGAR|nr:hypothetical protein D9611_005047 [Tulosesus angulatus]